MVFCIDKTRKTFSRKGKLKYSGILFPEIFIYYYFSAKHQSYFSFEKGKNTLFFTKEENYFFRESIENIKVETNFIKRNIIAIKNTPETLVFIKKVKMDYLFDKTLSENLWVHRSDANFIYKNLEKGLGVLENKVYFKEIKKPIHLHLINKYDKVFLNQFVSAEIINEIKIPFCLGRNGDVVIPEKEIPTAKKFLEKKFLKLITPNQITLSIFL